MGKKSSSFRKPRLLTVVFTAPSWRCFIAVFHSKKSRKPRTNKKHLMKYKGLETLKNQILKQFLKLEEMRTQKMSIRP